MSQIEFVSDSEVEPVTSYRLTAETLYEKCIALARNLWWSWNHEVINLFRDLDPIRWRQLDHNPIALLSEFTPERLEMRAAEIIHGRDSRLGPDEYRRARFAAGRLLFPRIRRA